MLRQQERRRGAAGRTGNASPGFLTIIRMKAVLNCYMASDEMKKIEPKYSIKGGKLIQSIYSYS